MEQQPYTGLGAVRFQCSGNDTRFCLHSGATCSEDIGGQICVCPEGFQHDFVLAHQPSCSLPTWYVPAFFAISTCGMGWAAFLMARASLRLKKTVKRIAHVFLAILAVEWLHVLCVFVQGASFVSGMVFAGLSANLLAYFAYEVVMAITSAIYAALKRPIHRWRKLMKVTSFFLGNSVTVCLFGSIAFVMEERDRGVFNSFVATNYILVGSGHFIMVTIIYIRVVGLERMIRSVISDTSQNMSTGANKLALFLQQLKALKVVLALDICNTMMIGQGICMFALGTFPYQFLLWSVFWTSLWPTTPFLIMFLRSKGTDHSATDGQSAGQKSAERRLVAASGEPGGRADLPKEGQVAPNGVSDTTGGGLEEGYVPNMSDKPIISLSNENVEAGG